MPYKEIPEEAGLIWYTQRQCLKAAETPNTQNDKISYQTKIYQMNRKV